VQEEELGWEDDEDETPGSASAGATSPSSPASKKPPPPIRIGTGEPGPGPQSASGKTRFEETEDDEEEDEDADADDDTVHAAPEKNAEVLEATKPNVGEKSALSTPATGQSPRHSSESSYDMVSGASSVAGEPSAASKKAHAGNEEDNDSDSDWE
jgi:hypothetical protein